MSVCLALALALATAAPAGAQEATRLSFVDAEVGAVIRSLTATLGLNVLMSQDVPAARVTYTTAGPVPNDSIPPILEAILEAHGLVLVNRGAVAQVFTLETAPSTGVLSSGRALPSPRPVGLVSHVVPLEYISPSEAVELLTPLAGSLSRIEALPRANGIMITDHATNVGRFLEVLRQLDGQAEGAAGRRTYVYRLRHASAAELSVTLAQAYGLRVAQPLSRPRVEALGDRSLSSSLDGFRQQELDALDLRRSLPLQTLSPSTTDAGPDAGPDDEPGPDQRTTIVPDLATNSLVIRTEPPNYPVLRETIEQLDVRPPQVLLEVQVAEVGLDEATQYGIDWTLFTSDSNDEVTARFGPQQFSDSALAGVQDFVLRTVRLGEVDVRSVIRALARDTEVRLLSTPRIVALNNEEARILVGSQVPFTQSTRAGLDIVVDQSVQYRDVGVQLTMIPTINDDGYVTFRMLQEVSSLTAQNVEAALGASVISTREAETSAIVRNGQTVVIGGLMDESDEVVESGVPVLRDIPLLGFLFKSRTTRRVRTELAIFVTPYVILTDEDAEELYQRARESLEPGGAAADSSGIGGTP